MPTIYKNPRTNRTFRVEHRGPYYVIVECDWRGEWPEVMAEYIDYDRAQDQLDKLAAKMNWEVLGDGTQ